MEHHLISAQHLSIDRIREILFRRLPLALSDDARARIVRCREYLDRKMENPERPVYGITTGFGSLCDISVGYDELAQLQKNLVMSHACGTGERVPSEVVKLILLLKIQSLSYGHSGVQLATVERLIDFFNNDLLPVVYQQGSLGASGDLAPLAHMSLPLLGLGEVEYKGAVRPAAGVLSELGWQPIELQSKEGLALLNGTQFMSAYGVWALIQSRRLSEWADRIGALSLDAFDGRIEPFCDEVHLIRAHRGQLAQRIHAPEGCDTPVVGEQPGIVERLQPIHLPAAQAEAAGGLDPDDRTDVLYQQPHSVRRNWMEDSIWGYITESLSMNGTRLRYSATICSIAAEERAGRRKSSACAALNSSMANTRSVLSTTR